MAIIKRIIAIAFVLVSLATVGVIISAGVLVLFPTVSIFGIKYVSTRQETEQTVVLKNSSNGVLTSNLSSTKLVIQTDGFDVKLVKYNVLHDKIHIGILNELNGFANNGVDDASVQTTYSYETQTVTVTTTEPSGFIPYRRTLLTIGLPKYFMEENGMSVEFRTNKGLLTIGDDENLINIKNLEAECLEYKGGLSLDNVNVHQKFTINNILGRIVVEQNLSAEVEINSRIGTYIFNNINILTVKGSDVEGVNNAPSITVKKVDTVLYEAESGILNIEEITDDIIINTKNAEINIGKASKTLTIDAENSYINIDEVGTRTISSSPSNINTYRGKVTINNSNTALNIITQSANIEVLNAYKLVHAESAIGAIKVSFDETNTNTTAIMLEVVTEEGSVNVANIKGAVNIQAINSTITADFLSVNGTNIIQSGAGPIDGTRTRGARAINVTAPVESYVLKTKSKTGSVNVDLVVIQYSTWVAETPSAFIETGTEDGYKFVRACIDGTTFANSNTLLVQTESGPIKVNDNL